MPTHGAFGGSWEQYHVSTTQVDLPLEKRPIIIGNYRLEKTLGLGAFGKVKSMFYQFVRWVGVNSRALYASGDSPADWN
jgi:hypothetical protein